MSSFPIDEAQLVGLFLESTTWGIQLVTYVYSVWTLTQTSRVSRCLLVNTAFLYASALIVVGTVHISLAFYHVLQAFVYFRGGASADVVFDQLSGFLTILMSVLDFMTILIADSALIYRCWIIYSRRWKYVIPSITLWLGGLACVCLDVYYTSASRQSTNLTGVKQALLSVGAFALCACILNIYTTALILWRIHVVHRASNRYFSAESRSGRLQWPQLIRILIESALIYTLAGIIGLAVNFAGSNALYPVYDLTIQLAGIQFDLIVIRVGRGIAVEHVEAQTNGRETQINLRTMGRPILANPGRTIDVSVTGELQTSVDKAYSRTHFDIEGVKPDLENGKSVGIANGYE